MTAARIFIKHGDDYTSMFGHKLINIMKHLFAFNATHEVFPKHRERHVAFKPEFLDALHAKADAGILSYYPWELLDVIQSTYRSTGISLDQPPTILTQDTISLDADGTPEWWTMGNVIGIKGLHTMIAAGHTNELCAVIAEVNLSCHLLIHLWKRSATVSDTDVEQFHMDFCTAIRSSSHELTDSFVYGPNGFKSPAQLNLPDPAWDAIHQHIMLSTLTTYNTATDTRVLPSVDLSFPQSDKYSIILKRLAEIQLPLL